MDGYSSAAHTVLPAVTCVTCYSMLPGSNFLPTSYAVSNFHYADDVRLILFKRELIRLEVYPLLISNPSRTPPRSKEIIIKEFLNHLRSRDWSRDEASKGARIHPSIVFS